MNSKPIRWTCLILLGILTYSLGLIRYSYILNLIDSSLPLLLPRNYGERSTYPLSLFDAWISFKTDPRWTSSIIYLCYPALATITTVYLLFNKKSYVLLTLFFYGIGIIFLCTMVLISLVLKDYQLGYGMAQQVKKIYQEPYISLLLLGGFYWDHKNRVEKESGERKR